MLTILLKLYGNAWIIGSCKCRLHLALKESNIPYPSYHSEYIYKNEPITRFKYHCAQNAQRQENSKKSKAPDVKHRDKGKLDVFHCHGWLFITIDDTSDTARVSYQHHEDRVPYYTIDVPPEIQMLVSENAENLTPSQVATYLNSFLITEYCSALGFDSPARSESEIFEEIYISALV